MCAWLAQSVEHETLNLRVVGSSPTLGVLEKRNQVARITFTTEAYTRSFLSKHSGIVRTELEGKEVNVVIRDSNIEERFVRIAGIPQNLDLGVVQTRLKEYGTVIDTRWERYRATEDDEVLYPVLATWMIVRMTLTKNIPSYVNIGSYRAIVKYEGQRPTCRLCDDENHFSNNCPTVRRNREASNAEKSRGAQNSHVEQAANAEPTVTILGNVVSLPEPSEEISLDLSSEANEAMETENVTTVNELASPDIPPGQCLPTMTIPETQSLGIPIPSVSTMDSTLPDTGNVVSIEEIVSHFTSIFKSQSSPDMLAGTSFLEGVKDCCKVYPNLTVPISSLEIKSALIQTKKNKSPGTDGIPYEFYLAFWDEIAHHFLDMFNHILERGTLTSSQGQAAIRLIPKCQDACGVSDFRPISLLNCDYKIMASVLARRLRHTLQTTIGPHQKGGFLVD
ncbi:hypothetical protein GHT06_004472 [Daphnia sinensis]|uniref:Reverse transcriptase domain-containing protein n=1 Tax=Daphnia sinensis TaxID=1820382 RepID=A0AAD5KFS7_9CRUS|nr:hypothetical protein GHT06_004472 [Daphnia sinensis]